MIPQVSIVIPVYRSAATLRELNERIERVMPVPFEIVFVNDASPDDSARVLQDLGARVVTHPENRGQNAAVLTGFAHAQGSTIVVLDADLQDPPEAIPELLRRKAETGAAIAFASRVGSYASEGRMLTSRIYKGLLSRLARVPAGAGLFVALDREAASRVLAMAPVPSIVAALGLLRLPTTEVPVVRAYGASSAYSGLARLTLAFRTLAWVLAHR